MATTAQFRVRQRLDSHGRRHPVSVVTGVRGASTCAESACARLGGAYARTPRVCTVRAATHEEAPDAAEPTP